jgi:putative PIN family toxin of toxin-antitoxin system
MNLDIRKNPVKVLLDTNILISAIGFGGKPRQILQLVLEKKIKAVTSPILLAEFHEIINKKFPNLAPHLQLIETKIKSIFLVVYPKVSINIVRDKDDNRVLEAAVQGKCQYIITGDKDLLELKIYQEIKIVTSEIFLKQLEII